MNPKKGGNYGYQEKRMGHPTQSNHRSGISHSRSIGWKRDVKILE